MAQNKSQLFDGSLLTNAISLPSGTTAQRPSPATNGMLRYNTTLGKVEQYANGQWIAITSPPTITTVTGGTLLSTDGGETVTINGTSFASGSTVKFISPNATEYTSPTVTFVSSIQITAETPSVASAGGDYDIKVTNSDGGTITSTDSVTFNGPPGFTSPAAGSLGSFPANTSISAITIVASEVDGGSITYTVTTGSLPSGLSLNSGSGIITGTPNSIGSATTSSFTITATDDESQTATRNYSITVTPNYLPPSSVSIP
jgi:hypothetical protein